MVLGAYPTRGGISFGPEIPGKCIHVTWFTKGGYFNSHLKMVEGGRTTYKTLVHEPVADFWNGILQQLRQRGFNKPYDPDGEVLLLTKNAMKYLEAIMQSAVSISIERRAIKLDVMLIPFIQEVMPKFASGDMLRYGKARELLSLPPLFRVGLSKDLQPLMITYQGSIATYPVDRDTWMAVLDERLGFNALIQYLGTKGLANSLIKSRTPAHRSV